MKHRTVSIALIIITFTIFLGSNFAHAYTPETGVQEGDVVDIEFEGEKQSDGSKFQQIARTEFEISATAGLIEGFWKGILGMRIGEDKQIIVLADKGYTNPSTAPVGLYDENLIFQVHLYAIVSNINDQDPEPGNLSGTIGTILTVIGVIFVSVFVVIGLYGLRSKAIAADCVHCDSMGRKGVTAEGKCSKCGQTYCRASFSRGCPNCKGNSFIPN